MQHIYYIRFANNMIMDYYVGNALWVWLKYNSNGYKCIILFWDGRHLKSLSCWIWKRYFLWRTNLSLSVLLSAIFEPCFCLSWFIQHMHISFTCKFFYTLTHWNSPLYFKLYVYIKFVNLFYIYFRCISMINKTKNSYWYYNIPIDNSRAFCIL